MLGAIAAATGLPAVELARVVAYDDVQTVLAAALKLLPLDPADADRVVRRAARPTSERLAPRSRH